MLAKSFDSMEIVFNGVAIERRQVVGIHVIAVANYDQLGVVAINP